MAFEDHPEVSLNYDENTCDRQSDFRSWVLFSKWAKFYADCENAIKIWENVEVFGRMAIEHVAGISLNYDKNTCHRQSTC